jgi:hypothetical protein
LKINPIVSVDEFFYDDANTPWRPLPEHDLKQFLLKKYHFFCKETKYPNMEKKIEKSRLLGSVGFEHCW